MTEDRPHWFQSRHMPLLRLAPVTEACGEGRREGEGVSVCVGVCVGGCGVGG